MFSFFKRQTGVDFNSLPPQTRGKICQVLDPSQALYFHPREQGLVWRIVIIIISALWLIYLWQDGHGIVGHELAIHSFWDIHWYFFPIALTAALVFGYYKRYYVFKSLAWKPGIYMTSTDIIDAESSILVINPSTSMEEHLVYHAYDVDGNYTATTLSLSFKNGYSVAFTLDDPEGVKEIWHKWTNQMALIRMAQDNGDEARVKLFDPFAEERKQFWHFEPQSTPNASPLADSLPKHIRYARTLIIPAVLVATLASWSLRNYSSDRVLVEKLHGFTSVKNWEWYVEVGGYQSEKAKLEWLPEAALMVGISRDRSMTALREFEEKFSGPEYQHYRDRASIEIANAALASATARESVKALRSFMQDFTRGIHADLRNQAQAKIHELYMQAHEDFSRQASRKDPRLVPFFKQLLTWLAENNSVDVQVSFKGPGQDVVDKIDNATKQSFDWKFTRADSGETIPIIPLKGHYHPNRSKKREQVILELLQESYKAIFPQDIFVPKITEIVDEQSAPSLEVRYSIEPMKDKDGDVVIYTDPDDTKGVGHIGFRFIFSIKMRVPNSEQIIEFPVELEPPDRFVVFGATSMDLPEGDALNKLTLDQRVYDTMASVAFNSFATAIQKALFQEGSDGFEAARLPERRLLRRVLVDLAAMQDGESSNAEMALEVFSDMTGDIFSKPAFVDSVNEARKRKEDESPKFSLEDLTNNLTNKNTKTMVVRGAARFAISTGGETNEQENRYISDLMELLDVTTNDLEEKNSPPDDN